LAPFNLEPKARVTVVALATFASWDWQETKFRPDDHRGRFIVHAIKGATTKLAGKRETLSVGPGGSAVTVTAANFELIADYFARWAARLIEDGYAAGEIVLAPLPSSQAIPELADYRSLNLAERIAGYLGDRCTVWAGTRFKQARQPVHDGGSRRTISDDMILISPPPPGAIVPIDDVFTQGAHLGALMKLLHHDRWPDLMIVGGKTVHAPPEKVIHPGAFQFEFYG
jgi:hypothetical protein